jgi:molecular chaperone GrpE
VSELEPNENNDTAGEAPEASEAGDAPAEAESTVVVDSELETVTAERNKLKDQLLRTAADFENYRKRARKDLEDAEMRAKESVLRETLTVIDNLERAVAASANATDAQAVADGVRLVLKSFDDIASRIGLERVPAAGLRFDPSLHDAVSQVESLDLEPGTVVTEVLPGYRLGARLLRPAMVVVAKAPTN